MTLDGWNMPDWIDSGQAGRTWVDRYGPAVAAALS
jgi:hypothetical protein